jgi:5-methylthioribose kinase
LIELSRENAAGYLCERVDDGPWIITELGGGVSNTVLLAETPGLRLVLKQALGKLRVEQDWFSDRRRILREARAMCAFSEWLPGGAPDLFFEDRDNLIIGMSAAPAEAMTWKSLLMSGDVRIETAARIGGMLGAFVRNSWRRPEWEEEFGDQTVFDQLRLDPYYRSTAARHPDLRAYFERLIEESRTRSASLVHGDWSPKNFLIAGDSVLAIDFEVIHFGDPAFDTGFLLNHLLLKSFYRPQWKARYAAAAQAFWAAYGDPGGIEAATVRHLGCLLLARIDGKSPAEYIQDEALRARIRGFARELILAPPDHVMEVFDRL